MEEQAFEDYIQACARSEADGVNELLHSKSSQLDNTARANRWFIRCCWNNYVTEAELLLKTSGSLINLRAYSSLDLWCIYRANRAAILELLVKYAHERTVYTNKGQFLRYMLRHSRYRPIQTLMFDHEGWFDWDNPSIATLTSICKYASLELIKLVFGRLGPSISPDIICGLFPTIRHRYDQILIFFLDRYASVLTPEAVNSGLTNICKQKRRSNVSIIMDLCMDKLTDWTFCVGFEHCCSTSNYGLMERMISSHMDRIKTDPVFIGHTLRRICMFQDIDTISFMLRMCGSLVCEYIFKESCEWDDLEACRMLIDTYHDQLVSCMPIELKNACAKGDTDIAELIIDVIEDSITADDCVLAFTAACSNNHMPIIELMSQRFPIILNFGSNADHAPWVFKINTETEKLLDRIYGTTLSYRDMRPPIFNREPDPWE